MIMSDDHDTDLFDHILITMIKKILIIIYDMIQTIMMIFIIFKIDMAVELPKALWWKIFSS